MTYVNCLLMKSISEIYSIAQRVFKKKTYLPCFILKGFVLKSKYSMGLSNSIFNVALSPRI